MENLPDLILSLAERLTLPGAGAATVLTLITLFLVGQQRHAVYADPRSPTQIRFGADTHLREELFRLVKIGSLFFVCLVVFSPPEMTPVLTLEDRRTLVRGGLLIMVWTMMGGSAMSLFYWWQLRRLYRRTGGWGRTWP